MVVIQCYNTLIGRDNYILGKGGVLGQGKGSGLVWECLMSQLRLQHAKINTLNKNPPPEQSKGVINGIYLDPMLKHFELLSLGF